MMVPGIDPSLFEPIGRITVNFAMLQGMVESAIHLLLFGNGSGEWRAGQIVTAELSFRRAVELFSCLYRHRFRGQHEDALSAICNKLSDCEAERNRITHSHWGGGSMRFKITAKQKGWHMQAQKMGRDDITAIGDKIAAVAVDLQDFMLEFVYGVVPGGAPQNGT